MAFIPTAVLTALLFCKPVTSMLLLYYAQQYFVLKGEFYYGSEEVIALMAWVRSTPVHSAASVMKPSPAQESIAPCV